MHVVRLTVALIFMLACAGAQAQRAQSFGPYEIHYNALPTADLQAEIASQYGVVRSRTRALVVVTILRAEQTVAGEVTGRVRNSAGQSKVLSMRAVREGDTTYYLATTPVDPPDELRISLRVRPRDAQGEPYTLTFTQSFYQPE